MVFDIPVYVVKGIDMSGWINNIHDPHINIM